MRRWQRSSTTMWPIPSTAASGTYPFTRVPTLWSTARETCATVPTTPTGTPTPHSAPFPKGTETSSENKRSHSAGNLGSRMRGESLCAYQRRCYSAAELELKQTKRSHMSDEYIHALDRFVFRLFMGCRSKQLVKGVSWGVDTEKLVLQLLREACVELREAGDLPLDPKLCRNPTVFPWPPHEKLANFEYTKIPPQLDTITRMDSR